MLRRRRGSRGEGGPASIGAGAIVTAACLLVTGCTVSFDVTVPDTGSSAGGVNVIPVYSPVDIMYSSLWGVDMAGNILWGWEDQVGNVQDVEFRANGNLLAIVGNCIREFTPQGVPVFRYPTDITHHDMDIMPDGSFIYLYGYGGMTEPYGWTSLDSIRQIDPDTYEILWEWKAVDHLDLSHHCPFCITQLWFEFGKDWTHANSLEYREAESAIYLNLRNLNQVVKIDYPSGEIIWTLGDNGDFGEGLFSHAHDVTFTPEGNLLLFDNGLHRSDGLEWSRAVEIAVDERRGDAEIVWEYREDPDFFCNVIGAAQRLPNGNTLIVDGVHGRLVEVLPSGEKAWEMTTQRGDHWVFNMKRLFD